MSAEQDFKRVQDRWHFPTAEDKDWIDHLTKMGHFEEAANFIQQMSRDQHGICFRAFPYWTESFVISL